MWSGIFSCMVGSIGRLDSACYAFDPLVFPCRIPLRRWLSVFPTSFHDAYLCGIAFCLLSDYSLYSYIIEKVRTRIKYYMDRMAVWLQDWDYSVAKRQIGAFEGSYTKASKIISHLSQSIGEVYWSSHVGHTTFSLFAHSENSWDPPRPGQSR